MTEFVFQRTVDDDTYTCVYCRVEESGSRHDPRMDQEEGDISGDAHSRPVDTGKDEPEQLDQLLKQCRLDQLLVKEKELSSDIGNIDIELRNVVYDNYTAFIAASDIVKNVKTALEGVDENLHALDSLVSQVVSQSETIDNKLNEQQGVIFQMNQSRSLLQRLTSLLRVPKTMKVAIERGAYEVAADIYLDTKSFLEKYGDDHAVLREIRDEVDIHRGHCAEALRAKIMQSSEGSSHGEVVVLLAKLGEPTASLIDIYLSSQMTKVQTELGVIDSAFSTSDSLPQVLDAIQPVVENLFGTVLAGAVRLSEDLFDDFSAKSVTVFVQKSTLAIFDKIQAGTLARCQETLARVGGFDMSGLELDQTFSTIEVLNREDVLEIEHVYTILDSLRHCTLGLDRLVPEAQVVHSFQLMVQEILETHIRSAFVLVGGRIFKNIKENIMKIVFNSTTEDDSNVYRFLKVHMKAIEVGIRQDFGIIRSCAMTWILQEWMQKEWIDTVLQCISDSWEGIMLYLASRSGSMAGLELSYPTLVPGFIERQFAIPDHLNPQSTHITFLYLASQIQKLHICLQGRTEDLYQGIYLVSSSSKEGSPSSGHSFLPAATQALKISEDLLEKYIESRKSQLGDQIDAAFEGIITQASHSPGESSAAAKHIIQTMANIDADFNNTGYGHVSETDGIQEHSYDNASSMNAIWSVLESSTERAMHKIEDIARISTFVFQQLQIDCHVIKANVSQYVDDTRRLSALFDALPITAAKHCDDPILLDPIALDRALSKYN